MVFDFSISFEKRRQTLSSPISRPMYESESLIYLNLLISASLLKSFEFIESIGKEVLL